MREVPSRASAGRLSGVTRGGGLRVDRAKTLVTTALSSTPRVQVARANKISLIPRQGKGVTSVRTL